MKLQIFDPDFFEYTNCFKFKALKLKLSKDNYSMHRCSRNKYQVFRVVYSPKSKISAGDQVLPQNACHIDILINHRQKEMAQAEEQPKDITILGISKK